jgi:DNA-binding SARP family transcriptional activator
LKVCVLGTFEVERDGEPLVLPNGQQRALLAILALIPHRAVSRDAIIERLWSGEAPSGAVTTIRGYVMRLRRVLDAGRGPSYIRTVARGYRLELESGDLDLHRFDELVARASRATDPGEEAALLDRALAVWRGPALYDVECDALQREFVPVLRERYLQATHRRIELALARDPVTVVADLRRLVSEYPIREEFWVQLMLALHLAGRRAEALACYAECRAVLAEQLGVDPGTRLRELHHRVLTSDGADVTGN